MNPFNPYGTHQRVLVAACSQTTGPIIELGCGDWSTRLLHDFFPDRYIVSVETNMEWMTKYVHLRSPNHVFMLLKDFSFYRSPVARAGVLFIDFDPGRQRRGILLQEANSADMLICHDTEPTCHPDYAWGTIFDTFKYRYDDTVSGRWQQDGGMYARGTTVVSNTQPFFSPPPEIN